MASSCCTSRVGVLGATGVAAACLGGGASRMDACAAKLGCPAALSIVGDSTFVGKSQPCCRVQLAIFCFAGSLPGDCQASVPATPMHIATRKNIYKLLIPTVRHRREATLANIDGPLARGQTLAARFGADVSVPLLANEVEGVAKARASGFVRLYGWLAGGCCVGPRRYREQHRQRARGDPAARFVREKRQKNTKNGRRERPPRGSWRPKPTWPSSSPAHLPRGPLSRCTARGDPAQILRDRPPPALAAASGVVLPKRQASVILITGLEPHGPAAQLTLAEFPLGGVLEIGAVRARWRHCG